MVEHEAHSVTVPIDSANTLAERRDQIPQVLEQDVRQDCPLEMAPQPFDEVQARTVRRQPVDRDPVGVGLQPLLDCPRVMEPAIVAYQADLATGVCLDEGNQEDQEVHPALAVGDGVRDLGRRVIDATIDNLLLVLAGCRDLRLGAHRRPHPRQRRMPMDLHLVLENQSLRSVLLQRFFLADAVGSWPSRTPPRRVCPSWCAWDDEPNNLLDARADASDRR